MRAPAIGNAVAKQLPGGSGTDYFDLTRFDGGEAIDFPAGIAD
jgi:hypothetical protein